MRTRNLVLANLIWAMMALLVLLPRGAFADPNGPADRTPADRRLEDKRVDDIRLTMTDSYATVTKLVVLTADCAFRSATDAIRRRNVNRLGFTQDIPLVGGFFADTPRQRDFTDANQIGLAYLDGSRMFVDLRGTGGPPTTDRALLNALAEGPTGGQSANFALNGAAPPFAGLSVVNRDFQFLVPSANFSALAAPGKSCAKDAFAGLPLLASMFDKPVGSAHLVNGQIVVLIKPSIIAGN